MIIDRALCLENVFHGEPTFRPSGDTPERSARFASLFPKPVKKGWFIFGRLEYPNITRDQIREVLVRNRLVTEGADPEVAIDEALGRYYPLEDEYFYRFVEFADGNGNRSYQLQQARYLSASM